MISSEEDPTILRLRADGRFRFEGNCRVMVRHCAGGLRLSVIEENARESEVRSGKLYNYPGVSHVVVYKDTSLAQVNSESRAGAHSEGV